ncbi:hypothetical protein CCZ01_03455 [Helicobacter monodelphidis]|uniref:c-type cytochrome n=1 Tax=Helicobacter sp. 15-1451 TaxID=2004995 RepID=UPI000DCD286B|nr:c-type cytochrome [Helicobacter sp. 15-1451]RAX58142.1 hypothetical protein CCZ01_03455 [Helicobacter sp. 15-1451]
MQRVFLILFFSLCLWAEDESFITQFEYGRMLYENPRGIGCVSCHGLEGEGREIAIYHNKKGMQILSGGVINNLDYSQFASTLKKGTRVMPRYYLEDSEIRAIHLYLKEMRDFKASSR